MAEEKRFIVTEEFFQKLQEQYDYRVNVCRKQIAVLIETARGFGDPSENAEYTVALEEQEKNEAEIHRLEAFIANARVITEGTAITEDDMRWLQERLSKRIEESAMLAGAIRNVRSSPCSQDHLEYLLEKQSETRAEILRLQRLIANTTAVSDGDAPADAAANP